MSRNRSRKAARYGRLAEEVAARHYDLDLDHSEFRGVRVDARGPGGRAFDVKAAMSNRTSSKPRFRLWKDQHDVLNAVDGGYVFVLYRALGRGIRVEKIRSVSARSLPSITWGVGGHRGGGSQVKIPPSAIFD